MPELTEKFNRMLKPHETDRTYRCMSWLHDETLQIAVLSNEVDGSHGIEEKRFKLAFLYISGVVRGTFGQWA